MKSTHAIVFAILGVAMFSGNVWMQGHWQPGTSTDKGEDGTRAAAGEPETPGAWDAAMLAPVVQEETSEDPPGESPADWAVEQVISK